MSALLGTKRLSRGQSIVKIVAFQPYLDSVTTKYPCFLDFLLRCRDRHEDHALDPKVAAHECDALCMIARRRTNKEPPVGIGCHHLAHSIEGAAQFVGSNRRQVFTLQPDIGFKPFRQMCVSLERRRGKNLAHGAFGSAGLVLEVGHSRSLAQLETFRKTKL